MSLYVPFQIMDSCCAASSALEGEVREGDTEGRENGRDTGCDWAVIREEEVSESEITKKSE